MFPFHDNSLEINSFKKPPLQLYDQIQNPIISKRDESPFFSDFLSPFFDEHELPLNQIFPNFHSKPPPFPTLTPSDHPQKTSDPTKKYPPKSKQKLAAAPSRRRSLDASAPRKRTGKKDRHSKICTAQGIRDRRMRLSLQVARKFFDLQDMLGYDKASKTIEWLFSKSKKAIKELANDVGVRGNDVSIPMSDGKSESFVSECEVGSGIEENCSNNEIVEGLAAEDIQKKSKAIACKQNTRESREKARARARCRTEEKMMGKRVELSPHRKVLETLGSSSSSPIFDGDDQERVSAYGAAGDYAHLLHPLSDAGTIERLLESSSSAAVSCCIDPSSIFMGFLGNWDLLSNDHRLNYAGNPNLINYSATTPDFPLFHQ